MAEPSFSFETLALHVGQEPDAATGATVPPVHLTSTFTQPGLGENKGWEYSRVTNPTRDALERCLAALEGGAACASFASGMAAVTAVLHSLKPGDGVVAGRDLYGGTYRSLEKIFKPWGIQVAYTEDISPAAYREALRNVERPRLVWVETPTNPLLRIADIGAIARVVESFPGCQLVVDNTFATPYLQQPISLGADIVVHSTTKYLGGHSDVTGGAVITRTAEGIEPFRFYQKAAGNVSAPFDCWLTQRGIKTLAVRMDRHCENALLFAEAMQRTKGVEKIHYPGLLKHKGHTTAVKQMRACGGVVSVQFAGGQDTVKRLLSRLRVFALAEGLGGAESMVGYPAMMSHAGMPREERIARGIVDGLVRFSVGIENIDDIVGDVRQALA